MPARASQAARSSGVSHAVAVSGARSSATWTPYPKGLTLQVTTPRVALVEASSDACCTVSTTEENTMRALTVLEPGAQPVVAEIPAPVAGQIGRASCRERV